TDTLAKRWIEQAIQDTCLKLNDWRLGILEHCELDSVEIRATTHPVVLVSLQCKAVALCPIGHGKWTGAYSFCRCIRALPRLRIEHIEVVKEFPGERSEERR